MDVSMESCSPTATASEHTKPPPTTVLWDRQECIPLSKVLSDNDIVLLLTPVVVPLGDDTPDTTDPFELLGKSLAKRHPMVRHVPYSKTGGITGIHVAFIRRAKVVLFVITGFPEVDGVSQPALAEMVAEVCESRPLIVVACCSFDEKDAEAFGFSTIIKAPNFARPDLLAITSMLLGEPLTIPQPTSPVKPFPPAFEWNVQSWEVGRDLTGAHELWTSSLPSKFHLDKPTWGSLLKRDGYAMHYVVREPSSGQVIGFCATYTNFAFKSEDLLVGSIAAIIVRQDFRGRGIGLALHDEALARLHKVRGTRQIQLGSTFPRLLYGLPIDAEAAPWFRRRGWTIEEPGFVKSQIVADWILRFSDLPTLNLASAGLTFKSFEFDHYSEVMGLITRESERKRCFGWYDQYAKVLDTAFMEDIVLGFEGSTLVATAITYIPKNGSPVAADLPWAGTIGSDMGGVTCICIKDDDPEMVSRRNTVMVRLLHGCRKYLSEKGMAGMFIDGVKLDGHGFESLGFRRWAEYREVWRSN